MWHRTRRNTSVVCIGICVLPGFKAYTDWVGTNLGGIGHPKVWKKKLHCLDRPSLKVHNTERGRPLRFSQIGEQRLS